MTEAEEVELRRALGRALGDREQARTGAVQAQRALDDMPARPEDVEAATLWDLEREELGGRLELAQGAIRAAEQALRTAKAAVDALHNAPGAAEERREQAEAIAGDRAARAATRAPRGNVGEGLGDLVATWEARAAELEVATATLPCTPGRRGADAALAAGDAPTRARATVLAARACEAVGAYRDCEFARAAWCPRAGAEEVYGAVATNIREGRIPAKQRRLLSGHFGLHGAKRAPLATAGFDAFAVAEALYTRKAATVQTLAGEVALRGDETIAVFYGPTGRGKTVAGCYLIAQLGGIYMTSYELAGVGQDAAVPTRAQMLAAPVLVIDQLGRQHRSAADYAHATLEWISDRRYAEERLLILIGNYESEQQFAEDVDGVIASRVDGDGVYVQCYGDDVRTLPPGAPGAGRR